MAKSGIKEFFRKRLVSLKRNPQNIALVCFGLSFIYYSLNLTCISDTTAKIQGMGMGLCGFATMLFSILGLVCYMNSFPRRKKANVPMVVLMFLMAGIVIFADLRYDSLIMRAVTRAENPIAVTEYIAKAHHVLRYHVYFLAGSVVITALLPVYSKLLRKIKTSIDVEDNGEMGAIDIED